MTIDEHVNTFFDKLSIEAASNIVYSLIQESTKMIATRNIQNDEEFLEVIKELNYKFKEITNTINKKIDNESLLIQKINPNGFNAIVSSILNIPDINYKDN